MDLTDENFEMVLSNTTSRPRRNVNKVQRDMLVSATKTRNWALKDPILDWLAIKFPDVEPSAFVQHLFKQGNTFERIALGHLMSLFDVKQIVNNPPKNKAEILVAFEKTKRAMKDGYPIIYQGCVYSKKHSIWGLTDFLVRSDYVNSIVSGLYTENQTKLGCNGRDYHYVVFDTKWSTVQLLSEGVYVSNAKKSSVYKHQLAVYSICLEEYQKVGVQTAFVLGRRYKYIKDGLTVVNDSCFDMAGRIDFMNHDSNYIPQALQAVKWYRKAHTEGKNWYVFPKPCKEELYPNMKNYTDDPYRAIKERIASKIGEITSVWYCGYDARQSAFDHGIFQWTDPRCDTDTMSITGKKVAPIVTAILSVNRSIVDKIQPSTLENVEWLNTTGKAFFVDFEFDNCLYDNFETFPKSVTGTVVYMIGVGHYEKTTNGNIWVYKNFLANTINKDDEKSIFTELVNYLNQHADSNSRMYHWSSAERVRMRTIDHEIQRGLDKYHWVDMLSEIKKTPIVVKGALGFGLKAYATALADQGLITTRWKSGDSGLDTITKINHFNALAHTHKTTINSIPGHETIIEYNEVDCKVVGEIYQLFRQLYCPEPEPVTPRRSQRKRKNIIEIPPRKRRAVISEPIDDDDVRVIVEPFVIPIDDDAKSFDHSVDLSDDSDDLYDSDDSDSEDEEKSEEVKELERALDDHIGAVEPNRVSIRNLIEIMIIVTSERYQTMNKHNKLLIAEYIRSLLHHHPNDSSAINCMNSIRFLTGHHPMYNTDNYSDELGSVVDDIRQLNDNHIVTYEQIASSTLTIEMKSQLFGRLVRLHALSVLDAEFQRENRRIKNILEGNTRDNYVGRIALSKFTNNIKAMLNKKYMNMGSKDDSDSGKLREWFETVLSIPVGRYSQKDVEPTKTLEKCWNEMNELVHGMCPAKEEVMEYMAEVLTTKCNAGNILCLLGSPGIGKTQLIQSLGKATGRPVIKIELGGMTDVHNLVGHNYTYVGSQPGVLVRRLSEKKCQRMDPIIVWEEMDKIPDTARGQEIQSKLMHILDPLQNNEFVDDYIGFPINLSKCFHVITINTVKTLHPVLKDRLGIVQVPNPSAEDKVAIAKKHFVPQLEKEFEVKLVIDDKILKYIVKHTHSEEGVRQLRRNIRSIYRKIKLVQHFPHTSYGKNWDLTVEPFIITTEIVDACISKEKQEALTYFM